MANRPLDPDIYRALDDRGLVVIHADAIADTLMLLAGEDSEAERRIRDALADALNNDPNASAAGDAKNEDRPQKRPVEFLAEEPPRGSVVAIDWGSHRQEIWVSNRSNIGNWYCPDISWDYSKRHPTWIDVKWRAEGRTLTLLVPGDEDAYKTGFKAGAVATGRAVQNVIEDLEYE